jgi:hypothetical protein
MNVLAQRERQTQEKTMHYLFLLCVAALMMLNEPIASAIDHGTAAVGGQDVGSVVAPAAAPAALDVLSSSSQIITDCERFYCLQSSANLALAVAQIQEGSRLLYIPSLVSFDNLTQPLPSDKALLLTSSRSQEAVPRRTT